MQWSKEGQTIQWSKGQTIQWPTEGQTIQWSKEGQTIQWSKEGQTIQCLIIVLSVLLFVIVLSVLLFVIVLTTRTPLKTEGEFRCSGRVSYACFTSGNRSKLLAFVLLFCFVSLERGVISLLLWNNISVQCSDWTILNYQYETCTQKFSNHMPRTHNHKLPLRLKGSSCHYNSIVQCTLLLFAISKSH
jgi:hypothetical protein